MLGNFTIIKASFIKIHDTTVTLFCCVFLTQASFIFMRTSVSQKKKNSSQIILRFL